MSGVPGCLRRVLLFMGSVLLLAVIAWAVTGCWPYRWPG